MNTTIQIRIDKKVKVKAQKIFESMGLDISSAVKLYFSQVFSTSSIPFPIVSADYLPEKTKSMLVKEADKASRSKRGFKTAEELHRHILGNKFSS